MLVQDDDLALAKLLQEQEQMFLRLRYSSCYTSRYSCTCAGLNIVAFVQEQPADPQHT